MKDKGIGRVVCLLSPSQLEDYETPLVESYRRFFGSGNTLWNPVQDFSLISSSDMSERIMPFLLESERAWHPCGGPLLRRNGAHRDRAGCLAQPGKGTDPLRRAGGGHTAAGRKPMEVVEAGRATMQELLLLVGSK
ncbi:MAG: hypothetical protein M0C28_15695 [Candidatus Moduliflexus flocculans]|nr:hypothetical protein [Candidatus Moduliflexus flocculans]